jgi:hypothetical protein
MGGYAYVAPGSIDEAVAVLTEHAGQGKRAQILAGGTDLLVQMQSLDNSPRTIVDIKQIAETNAVDIGASETYIGAAIPSAVLNENSDLKAMFPGLLESADLIGSTQIQGRASIGGNLCNSSPAGDTIPAMIVNAGICVIAGSAGTRELDQQVGRWRNSDRAEVSESGASHSRRLPEIHSAHGNGYCGCGCGRLPHAGREWNLHGRPGRHWRGCDHRAAGRGCCCRAGRYQGGRPGAGGRSSGLL